MERTELLALLDGLDEPAFFEKEGSVQLANQAARMLGAAEGAKPEAFLFSEGTDAPASDRRFCTAAGVSYNCRNVPMSDGTLWLLYPAETRISVNALANTAVSLREALQQLYNAMDCLDQALPEGEERTEKSLSSMLQGIFRIGRLADNLGSLQQLESGVTPKPVRMDLRAMLLSLLEKAEALLELAGIELRYEIPATTFVGSVDPKLFSLAFWNLLANAAQNANGGVVRVTAERVRLSKLRIKFTDSGTGIKAERQANLLSRFQADPSGDLQQTGTGLGLSLAGAVARLHGGTLAISMEPGNATTVAMVLETNRAGEISLHSGVEVFEKSLDEGLLGLSEVLPSSAYDRRDIL